MPRGKPQSQTPAASQSQMVVDSDGEETRATQNFTQAKKAIANMSREEKMEKLHDLVQYLLILDQKKLPIKRQDINKHVLKEHSKAFPLMMEDAKKMLSEVFGFSLVELTGKNKNSFLLANQHHGEHLTWSDSEQQHTALLMLILTTIFMCGNIINEDQLLHMLSKMGIDPERPHPIFGEIKKHLAELIRHNYLEKNIIPSDPPGIEYTWGQRAKQELTKAKCLQFVCGVYGMEDMSQWVSQWQDVVRSEGAANGLANGQDSMDE